MREGIMVHGIIVHIHRHLRENSVDVTGASVNIP